MNLMEMNFKETYMHSWIATIDENIELKDLLCLTKSKFVEKPIFYSLSTTTTISKIEKVPFVHNNMIGDILIVNPLVKEFLLSELSNNIQVIPCVICCKDGEIKDYSIINTLYCEKIVDEDNSEKIIFNKEGDFFMGQLALYKNLDQIILKPIVRDCKNGNRLFFTEEFVQKLKEHKLNKFVSFSPYISYK